MIFLWVSAIIVSKINGGICNGETRTRILGIAPYEGMHTAMDRAAAAYPNVQLDVFTGDLDVGVAIVQSMSPNSYDCIISRGGTAEPDPPGDRSAGSGDSAFRI